MYCVNCGKQVNGQIPICQDCALRVLHSASDNSLTQKVKLEAEDFNIISDSKITDANIDVNKQIESTSKQSSNSNEDKDYSILIKIAISAMVIIIVIVLSSLF